jgi:hypothetical protein
MPWEVRFDHAFEAEFDRLPEAVQDELLARVKVLEQFGPQLGRPHVDTLKDSKHANMKELRFNCEDGAWRVAFAFDLNAKLCSSSRVTRLEPIKGNFTRN